MRLALHRVCQRWPRLNWPVWIIDQQPIFICVWIDKKPAGCNFWGFDLHVKPLPMLDSKRDFCQIPAELLHIGGRALNICFYKSIGLFWIEDRKRQTDRGNPAGKVFIKVFPVTPMGVAERISVFFFFKFNFVWFDLIVSLSASLSLSLSLTYSTFKRDKIQMSIDLCFLFTG